MEDMNFVEPIRDPELVGLIAEYLRNQSERNYIMFMIGIYTGLRITDILNLSVSDVKNRDTINLREKKTGKQKIVVLNPILKKEFREYCKTMSKEERLIPQYMNPLKAISRITAYRILAKAAEEYGVENLGTHSMRKTYGYHMYQQYKDVVSLQKLMNHSSPSITLRYIGIEQEQINNQSKNLKIF